MPRHFIGLSVDPTWPITLQSTVQTIHTYLQDVSRSLSINEPANPTTPGGAFNNENYVTIGNAVNLSNERALVSGADISIQDNGPNNTVVVSFTGSLPTPAIWSGGYATATVEGTDTTFIRTDATLKFPDSLMDASEWGESDSYRRHGHSDHQTRHRSSTHDAQH